MHKSPLRIVPLVTCAMLAFAGNSILCRLALAEGFIDAGSFTLIRLVSGAVTLVLLTLAMYSKASYSPSNWHKSDMLGALMLLGYAAAFSFSYINITTGTGALILFASVQFTMIGYHLFSGNKLQFWECIGLGLSLSGFGYLLVPHASRPDLLAAALMAIAGICWAAFTILGKSFSERPAMVTMAMSFALATLLGGLIAAVSFPYLAAAASLSYRGVILAVTSGAVASGIGYAIWYAVLPALSILKASVVQLSVPALASIAGWIVLSEKITISTAIATTLILGGIALVFAARSNQ